MAKKITKEDFIKNAKEVHGSRYNYSLVNYINNRTKIKIVCKIHGEFEQQPNNHISNKGCSLCANEIRNKNNKLTKNDFIIKANLIHRGRYDYSLVDYKSNNKKIKIICKTHGNFEQIPINHLKGQNCPLCANKNRAKNKSLNKEKFILNAKNVHGDKYDYNLVKYNKMSEKIKIICPKHGEFLQTPLNHIHKNQGCSKCIESKGEEKIRLCLEDQNIDYKKQKKFIGCSNIRLLPFDFYLPNHNLLIEYDGEQHFKPIQVFGGEKSYELIKSNDKIKSLFAKKKKIKLIRIPYYKYNNIENILINVI